MTKTGTIAVFILHNGEWKLSATFLNTDDAEREATYLRDMLGITAKVFIKS